MVGDIRSGLYLLQWCQKENHRAKMQSVMLGQVTKLGLNTSHNYIFNLLQKCCLNLSVRNFLVGTSKVGRHRETGVGHFYWVGHCFLRFSGHGACENVL